MIEPMSVCELDAGRPSHQVPRFQMIAANSSAKTMAKPALVPTCNISSTGSSEMMPNATAPLEITNSPSNPIVLILFFGFLAAGILYMAYSVYVDVDASGAPATTFLPYLLLFVALLIALGFEFVNGFHDTANAVATVIYTHSMPAPVAVVWSGCFNFL